MDYAAENCGILMITRIETHKIHKTIGMKSKEACC